MKSFSFLAFVAMTFCCWGIYGPVLHVGQEQMAGGVGKASLRPFMCVGIAYFIIAVVYPLFVLKTKGENGNWTANGFAWSFAAGVITAIGALGIVLAFKFKGKPVYVMPLVFGLAPIVNTIVGMLMSGTTKKPTLPFYVGIVLVALGAAGVLRYQPKNNAAPKPAVSNAGVNLKTDSKSDHPKFRLVAYRQDQPETTSASEAENQAEETSSVADNTKQAESKSDSDATPAAPAKTPFNALAVTLCVATTVVCWGSYGPLLHRGQVHMNNSRLRPLLCVGLAYFGVAVLAPWILLSMETFPEPGGWSNVSGVVWSLVAGAAGALGSLGIIYAFNFGGKPIFVMPLIFGFAPVINTLTETFSANLLGQITSYFIISLAMVIIGAALVLVFAPKGHKPKPVPNEPAIT